MAFKSSVIEALGYYVYCLVDPRDNRIFYVGKGRGNRVFEHVQEALRECGGTSKDERIRDIERCGLHVRFYIVRHRLSEEEAYLVESALIDLLTFKGFNIESVLTNIQAGHHQWDEGIKSVEEINAMYDCVPLERLGDDRLLLVNLNKSYSGKAKERIYQRENDYERTRKYWKVNIERAESVDYVLGVYKGIVRTVYRPVRWELVRRDGYGAEDGRYMFDGDAVEGSPYLNKDVSQFMKGQTIRYIPD